MPGERNKKQVLGYLLEECSAIHRNLTTTVRDLTRDSGVTAAQWGILGVFAGPKGPFTVAEAARRINQSRQSVHGVADLLSEKGLIEYRSDPNHRRAKLVLITAQGRTLLRKLRTRQTRWTRQVAKDLKIKDINTALRSIRQIHQHLINRD
ncbi:MAG: MarR family transcriptional regulator [Gammaproteobacteria bacterium]|jgi:DNA-binding MarR family transcriptional regulator|nr:MarR family transcriptional regulator [Chromatiales bacterium]MDP6674591.1 MarR family transcriptional regulator [Gammaproteobacteria bacterium]